MAQTAENTPLTGAAAPDEGAAPEVAGREHAAGQLGAQDHPGPGAPVDSTSPTTPAPAGPPTGTTPLLTDPVPGSTPVVTPEQVTQVEQQVADLQLQEETVRQLLTLLADAAAYVDRGYPSGIDLGAFGASRRGSRMARHTAGAQERVAEALDMASQALAQHQLAIEIFRNDLLEVEDEATTLLSILQQRAEDTVVSIERSVER